MNPPGLEVEEEEPIRGFVMLTARVPRMTGSLHLDFVFILGLAPSETKSVASFSVISLSLEVVRNSVIRQLVQLQVLVIRSHLYIARNADDEIRKEFENRTNLRGDSRSGTARLAVAKRGVAVVRQRAAWRMEVARSQRQEEILCEY
ncbi:uncharacterized protein G2W53_007265 [Senna tora]|uniref:Uncharacterized protein n=1 Tax=Senna tora TaxID=362788 RepID=A0A834X7B2_9FABA|nr:uncharacterized protein G2W53_007265 [Senna tora]